MSSFCFGTISSVVTFFQFDWLFSEIGKFATFTCLTFRSLCHYVQIKLKMCGANTNIVFLWWIFDKPIKFVLNFGAIRCRKTIALEMKRFTQQIASTHKTKHDSFVIVCRCVAVCIEFCDIKQQQQKPPFWFIRRMHILRSEFYRQKREEKKHKQQLWYCMREGLVCHFGMCFMCLCVHTGKKRERERVRIS